MSTRPDDYDLRLTVEQMQTLEWLLAEGIRERSELITSEGGNTDLYWVQDAVDERTQLLDVFRQLDTARRVPRPPG